MKLLYLDFESQSDDPQTTNVTEIGALLVEIPEEEQIRAMEKFPTTAFAQGWKEHPIRELKRYSQLVYHESYPPQTEEIVEITGITDEMLQREGIPAPSAFATLIPMVDEATYVLAHNAAFDRGIFESTCKRLGLDQLFNGPKWICTIQDVPYPKRYKCKKLAHLAYDHGIVVDPASLHRAINDVSLLSRLIFERYNFYDILRYRNTPWAYLRAVVPGPWIGNGGDGGIGVGQAKKLGYGWEKIWGTDIEFPKKWVKRVKETEIEAEKARCPFKITRLIPGAMEEV